MFFFSFLSNDPSMDKHVVSLRILVGESGSHQTEAENKKDLTSKRGRERRVSALCVSPPPPPPLPASPCICCSQITDEMPASVIVARWPAERTENVSGASVANCQSGFFQIHLSVCVLACVCMLVCVCACVGGLD